MKSVGGVTLETAAGMLRGGGPAERKRNKAA